MKVRSVLFHHKGVTVMNTKCIWPFLFARKQKKLPQWPVTVIIYCFKLFYFFYFIFRLHAFGANLGSLSVDFLFLNVDFNFSKTGDVGMTSGYSGFCTATANFTNSTHIFTNLTQIYYKFYTNTQIFYNTSLTEICVFVSMCL